MRSSLIILSAFRESHQLFIHPVLPKFTTAQYSPRKQAMLEVGDARFSSSDLRPRVRAGVPTPMPRIRQRFLRPGFQRGTGRRQRDRRDEVQSPPDGHEQEHTGQLEPKDENRRPVVFFCHRANPLPMTYATPAAKSTNASAEHRFGYQEFDSDHRQSESE